MFRLLAIASSNDQQNGFWNKPPSPVPCVPVAQAFARPSVEPIAHLLDPRQNLENTEDAHGMAWPEGKRLRHGVTYAHGMAYPSCL